MINGLASDSSQVLYQMWGVCLNDIILFYIIVQVFKTILLLKDTLCGCLFVVIVGDPQVP